MSAPARADARARIAMLRWMRLARELGLKLAGETAATRLAAAESLDSARDLGPTVDPAATMSAPEAVGPAGGNGLAAGTADTGLGREALLVGACLSAREADVLAPSPGDLAAYLMRGVSSREIVAQYLGRTAGASRGRDSGGSIGSAARRLIAPVSELVSSVSVAAGAAFGLARANEGAIALCFFRERASCRGDWHEGMNFAAVQRLPVVYVCASAAKMADQPDAWSAVERVSERAIAYGIPGVTIDGSDVMEVFEAVGDAAARARRGEGPSLIDGRISQMVIGPQGSAAGVGRSIWRDALAAPGGPTGKSGDSMSRSSALSNGEGLAPSRRPASPREDAIERFARGLVQEQLLDTAALAGMEADIEREVAEAFAWAGAQPYPVPDDLEGGLYSDTTRGRA